MIKVGGFSICRLQRCTRIRKTVFKYLEVPMILKTFTELTTYTCKYSLHFLYCYIEIVWFGVYYFVSAACMCWVMNQQQCYRYMGEHTLRYAYTWNLQCSPLHFPSPLNWDSRSHAMAVHYSHWMWTLAWLYFVHERAVPSPHARWSPVLAKMRPAQWVTLHKT